MKITDLTINQLEILFAIRLANENALKFTITNISIEEYTDEVISIILYCEEYAPARKYISLNKFYVNEIKYLQSIGVIF